VLLLAFPQKASLERSRSRGYTTYSMHITATIQPPSASRIATQSGTSLYHNSSSTQHWFNQGYQGCPQKGKAECLINLLEMQARRKNLKVFRDNIVKQEGSQRMFANTGRIRSDAGRLLARGMLVFEALRVALPVSAHPHQTRRTSLENVFLFLFPYI